MWKVLHHQVTRPSVFLQVKLFVVDYVYVEEILD